MKIWLYLHFIQQNLKGFVEWVVVVMHLFYVLWCDGMGWNYPGGQWCAKLYIFSNSVTICPFLISKEQTYLKQPTFSHQACIVTYPTNKLRNIMSQTISCLDKRLKKIIWISHGSFLTPKYFLSSTFCWQHFFLPLSHF